MKKIYLMTVVAILGVFTSVKAQVSGYAFSQSSGSFTPITGTLVAAANNADPTAAPESAPMDDHTFTNIAIPFNFKFNGANYSTINANTNGWVSFGTVSTSTSTPINSTTAYNGVISASAVDLMGIFATTGTVTSGSDVITAVGNTSFVKLGSPIRGTGIPAGATITAFDASTITISAPATAAAAATLVQWATGEIRTDVTGTAPNRSFIIQYSGFSRYSNSVSATDNNTALSFQIILNEGGGIEDQQTINIVYGTYYRAGGTSTTQVGLRGTANTDYNNRSSATDWGATIAGTSNSATVTWSNTIFPAPGLTYTWTPSIIHVDWSNLQFPPTATIPLAGSVAVYTQGYEPGVTNAPGAGTDVFAWIGVNATNTDPATWPASAWTAATYNVEAGNNDEFTATIGSTLGAGTYYYASRWKLGPLATPTTYRYGGYNAGGGGFWDGTTNVSGVLTVTPSVANDVCSGAIALTVNPDLACGSSVSGTTVGATQSPDLPAPTCSATGINDDVWYSFVATGATNVVSITGATNTTAIQVYSGTCGTLATVICGSTTTGALSQVVPGLTLGSTYLIRVYSTSATAGTTTNFTICVGTPPPPPANDNICGAVSLSVSGSTCTTGLVNQSTQFATQSLAACTGTADEDVWYSFVATGTSHIVTLTNSGAGNTDRVHQVYSTSDNTCSGTLTSLVCSDPETSTLTGLTIGNRYFVRVHSWGSGNYATFDICITTPVAPPANDVCSGAITLPVNATCVNQNFNTAGATDNNETGDCTNGTEKAVWFKFVATVPSINVTVTGAVGFDAVLGVLSGCGSAVVPTGGACVDATLDAGVEVRNLTGLTVGATYYIQVYDYQGDALPTSTFDICVAEAAPPPSCSVNTTPVNGATNVEYAAGTPIAWNAVAGATSYQIMFSSNGGTSYSNLGSTPNTTIAITGLSALTTYYFYVIPNNGAPATGCESTATSFTTGAVPAAPANDEPCAAVTIGATPTQGTTVSSTQNIPPALCSSATSTSANDVWYQFTATANGAAVVTLDNTGFADLVVQAFSGTCSSLTSLGCIDATTGDEVLPLTGLVAGQTYFVRVYGYDGEQGIFELSVTGAALPITIEYFRGTKQNGKNVLDWKVSCYNSPTVNLTIERSADGRNFTAIRSTTETAARCLQPFNYDDVAPLSGINYYRLKSVDADGKIAYSNLVALLNKEKGFEIVALSPNPVKDLAILNVTSAQSTIMEIVVTDLNGKQLSKQRVSLIAGNNQLPLSLGKLPAGTYQVTGLTADGQAKSTRFVKQ